MTLEDDLRRALTDLAERIRDEITRHSEAALEPIIEAAEADRARAAAEAAADAREAAEQAAAEMLEHAESRAHEDGRQAGVAEGRKLGWDEGLEKGRTEGLAEGLEKGRAEGIAEGIEKGRAEGHSASREEGLTEGHARGLAEGEERGRAEGFQQGHAQGLAEGLNRGREEGRERGREEGSKEGRAEGHAEGLALGIVKGRQEATAQRQAEQLAAGSLTQGVAESERLLEALRSIDAAHSLSAILDALATAASREASRISLLIVRGDRLRTWRSIGFGPGFDEATGAEFPVAEAGLIRDAIGNLEVTTGDSDTASAVPSFVGLPANRQMLAVPVVLGGQAVAVVYGDQGLNGESGYTSPDWRRTLDVLARHTARCLESVTALRAVQAVSRGGLEP